MLLYIASYVIDRPAMASSLFVAVTIGQFLGVLLWTKLTSRYDKSTLLVAGHGITALGLLLFGFCLAWPSVLIACAILIGVGLTSVYMLPWGLLADTVDCIAWRHGRRFETGLFAAYLVVVKGSGAASSAAIGWSLGLLGYEPGHAQPEAVRIGMIGLGLGLPIAGSLAATIVLRRFDLSHVRHARVIRALERRSRKAA